MDWSNTKNKQTNKQKQTKKTPKTYKQKQSKKPNNNNNKKNDKQTNKKTPHLNTFLPSFLSSNESWMKETTVLILPGVSDAWSNIFDILYSNYYKLYWASLKYLKNVTLIHFFLPSQLKMKSDSSSRHLYTYIISVVIVTAGTFEP